MLNFISEMENKASAYTTAFINTHAHNRVQLLSMIDRDKREDGGLGCHTYSPVCIGPVATLTEHRYCARACVCVSDILWEYLIKLLKYLFFSSLWAISHCVHISFCPSSLLIGCCCRNAEKPVKYTSSALGCLIGEGLWLAAGHLPATSTRPRCPRAPPWLLKQREKGVCATTTCATVITSTVGGLHPQWCL